MKQFPVANRQTGFTLIEVLIAVLVISIGLLGMAGLQTSGIQQSHNSYLKTQASMLAYDMADRMRSNLLGVNSGDYDSVDSVNDPVTATPGCISSGTACSASETATNDIYEWTNKNAEGSIASLLPSGYGMVSKNGDVFTITVLWDEARTGATGTDCSTDYSVDLKCFQLELIP
ncbi:MAG: type IV pilus modification protein PilV [Gammaproteobacteria bacterium]|jgi:type IV pilus assembly protein PilV